MGSQSLVILVFALAAVMTVECNSEVDDLFAWRTVLVDPNNVLQSWDPTLSNPCMWFHVTCSSLDSVTRVDLGNAGLSGPLVPQLGNLTNLQYLEVFGNNLSGSIPWELGQLSHLVSLDLYKNQFSGQIPLTLGNLKSLSYMRLNSNKLSGKIPVEVFQLIEWGHLRIMNVSENQLVGSVRHHTVTVTTIIQDAKA